jgi:integrase
MAVFKRGRVWWYEFVFGGQRVRESSRSTSKAVAVNAERRRHRELEEGFNGLKKRAEPKLFSVAAERWLALKMISLAPRSVLIEKTNLRHLFPSFGRMLISDIAAEDISEYQQRRLGENASPKTVNLEVGTIRAILIRNRLWADIKQDITMLPTRDDFGRSLSAEEEAPLMAACLRSRSRLLHPAVVLAINSGMRYSEIRLLTWNQIDFKKRIVTVGKSKTVYGTGRLIPLNDPVTSVLQFWAAQFPNRQPEHFVFPSERYGASGDAFRTCAYKTNPNVPVGSFKKAWAAAKKQAGVECRFHDLRHTACTLMLEAGRPFAVVAAVLGWSSATTIRMAKRYGHIGEEAMRKAMDAIGNRRQADPPEERDTGEIPDSVN